MSHYNSDSHNENNSFYKTANFNYEQPKQQDNDLSYFREMEDNMKLFEMKLKKLEKSTYGDFDNNNYHSQHKQEVRFVEPIVDQEMHPKYTQEEHKSDTTNRNFDIDNLIKELNHKNNIIAELTERLENSKNDSVVAELHKEIRMKDNECHRLYDENERLKALTDSLKRDNGALKTNNNKIEKENTSLTAKLHELDKENKLLEHKATTNEAMLKNLKFDYDNIFKNFTILRKQYAAVTEKMDELRASNQNLVQDKDIKPLNTHSHFAENAYMLNNYKLTHDMAGQPSVKKQPGTNKKVNYENVKLHTPNDIVEFPSEFKQQIHKNEISYIEQRISDLCKEKVHIENGLLKLPNNPRTLSEINKKKQMELELKEVEDKVAELKLRLRQINKK
jgi:chromosome segregation ATPase